MNTIALITGASRGLGRSAALALAKDGHDILFTYLSRQDDAQVLVDEIKALGRTAVALPLDVSNSQNFAAFAEQVAEALNTHWQRTDFDFLINNAGIGVHAPFSETTEAQFDLMLNIHLKGVFFLTQKLLPLIKNGGRILNISSGLTRFSFAGYTAYAVMKGAVETLSRYLALELAERRISVNTLAPGAIETDFGGGAVRDNAQLNQLIASKTALGRVGLPDDIGGVMTALLSENTGWINGQRIEAAGGIFL
jgi:NAD(P)-dependent dehydrogenase (short-subunit alcohol dehydrogenase family)